MEHPTPRLSRERLVETLATMLDAAMPACAHVAYRLVGTAAALLHGIDLPAADVDILVKRREDVDAFAAALSSFPCHTAPILLVEGRQYFARFEVAGVAVEFSTVEIDSNADTVEASGRGPWERYVMLPCRAHRVPVVALELRLVTELVRQRPDRYTPIIAALRARGCDLAFVRRALDVAGLSPDVRAEVLAQIEGPPEA